MIASLKSIVERQDTRAGLYFDLVIQALIVVSLVSFSVETLPDISEEMRLWLSRIEVATVAIFSAEYILRLLVADRRLRFVFSFNGLVDLLAVLPFYVATGVDLSSVRILRLFRVIRILKLTRFSKAAERIRIVFKEVRAELSLFLVMSLFVVYLSSVGIYYFESTAQPEVFSSIFHALWWSVVTLTTVGYGDIYPITAGGKVFTVIVLMVGLGMIAVPTGLITSALSDTKGSTEE